MTRLFVLEDDPVRRNLFDEVAIDGNLDYTSVVSVESAKKYFAPTYDLVCLDHDLGGKEMVESAEPDTGWQFVKWLTEQWAPTAAKAVVVHSYNPLGAANMTNHLKKYGWNVYQIPFGPDIIEAIKNLKKEADHAG